MDSSNAKLDLKLKGPAPWVLFVMSYGFLISLYFVIRYHGNWIDTDTALITGAARALQDEGTLVPKSFYYGNGYLYQLLIASVADLSGLSIDSIQTILLPIIGTVFGSCVFFVLFREYLKDEKFAAFGTILIYANPDFSFVALRGSHEKITWLLAALSLFFLIKSYQSSANLPKFIVNVVLLYLCVHALVSTNYFFGSSFALATLLSVLLGLIWIKLYSPRYLKEIFQPLLKRHLYITGTCLILLVVVVFYTYPPAGNALLAMKELYQKVAALFLSYQGQQYDSYEVISSGWVNQGVYVALISVDFFILGISFITFLFIVFKRQYQTRERILLALFYVAFALQVLMGVIADLSGSLGSNLQLRLLPAFLLSAIPMAMTGLKLFLATPGRSRVVARFAIPILLVFFSFNSLIKATNEPLVSNYWIFYSPAEQIGSLWFNAHLEGQLIWVDFDGLRLRSLWRQNYLTNPQTNDTKAGDPNPQTSYFFISDTIRRRSGRQQKPLPVPPDALQVYDNGEAQLYHLRPRTPYQQ